MKEEANRQQFEPGEVQWTGATKSQQTHIEWIMLIGHLKCNV
jgi:hypothetical protein